jgi:uncharacterized protein with PIN domain
VPRATLRFYAELNDLLPVERRQVTFVHQFAGRPAVKDLVEALGVPHTEVDMILANGESVDFTYKVGDGDRLAVYPVFEAFDIGTLARLRPEPLREPRFVLDVHLGRLARLLRLLGFDSLYSNAASEPSLAQASRAEHRIILTRDRGLLKRAEVTHGYCVRSTCPREQLAEVVARFDLVRAARPFTRCLACNGVLEPVDRADVQQCLPLLVGARHDVFRRCAECRRVFWKGSHHAALLRLVATVTAAVDERTVG